MSLIHYIHHARGQDRPGLGSLLPGGEDNQGGGKISRDSPGGKLSRGQDKLGHQLFLCSAAQGVKREMTILRLQRNQYHITAFNFIKFVASTINMLKDFCNAAEF